jgi:nucleoside-diphosphate-sugar epimerase
MQMAWVNVEGTRLILGAARDHHVEKVVHVSSVAAIGYRPGEMANETTQHRGYFFSEYERTKYLGEQEAMEAAATGLRVPAVRASSWGPGSAMPCRPCNRFLNWGRSVWLPDPLIPLVGLEDTVDGLIRAMDRGLSARRYILNAENIHLTDFLTMVAEVAGVPQRAYPLPSCAWSTPAGALRAFTGAMGPQRLHYWLTRAMYGAAFDAPRARDGLEVHFTPVREVLPAMLASMVERGLVRRPLPGLRSGVGAR